MSANSIRPARLIGVLGTNTEVGKTWVASQLIATLRLRGARVAARKPVQSYAPDDIYTDAARLAGASGEEIADICPAHRWYPVAMAPPMAADALGRGPVRMQELINEIHWPPGIDIGLVETVGGARSPLAFDGDSMQLIERLHVDQVLLVADAGLGTINAVRLCLDALSGKAVTVLLNRFDGSDRLHLANREWLERRAGVPIAIDAAVLAE